MKLTNAQTLILTMLADVAETLKVDTDSGIEPQFIRKALYSNNAWGISWKYPGLFADAAEPTPPLVHEVVNYIDMWDFVETSYKKLSQEQQVQLQKDSDTPDIFFQFVGFDGNNETEYLSIADFLIHDLDKWSLFSDRELNSHSETISRYRRMYSVFKTIRKDLAGKNLSPDQLKAIVKHS